jgi:hypothetical protein
VSTSKLVNITIHKLVGTVPVGLMYNPLPIEYTAPRPTLVSDELSILVHNLQAELPPEYEEAVKATTALWMRLGSNTFCGMCFRGELSKWKRGCCDRCLHLSDEGCVRKPLSCASWSCSDVKALLPTKKNFKKIALNQLRRGEFGLGLNIHGYSFYDRGFYNVTTHVWTPEQLKRLKHYTNRMKILVKLLDKMGWTPEQAVQQGLETFKLANKYAAIYEIGN